MAAESREFTTSQVVNWRNIAIALTDTDFGEQKAQSGENA
jgi:hypothetical protein